MDIKVIGSGSSGNCYLISDGTTALLLEAGLPIKRIKQGCDFNLPDACLITHEHGDHAAYAREVMKAGTDVWMSRGTAETLDLDGARIHSFSAKRNSNYFIHDYEPFSVGESLRVLPFQTEHDAAEPVGYLIYSKITQETLLFATDTYFIRNRFPALTHIMIEANYSAENIGNDPRRARLRKSHMSIEHCLEFLKANDLSRCREIWLIHLSKSNGEAEEFKHRVQEATGCEVHIT